MHIVFEAVLDARLDTTDGTAGFICDFYLDDWVVRYLAVSVPHRPDQQRLLAPAVIQQADWDNSSLQIDLPRQQIENAPTFGRYQPISQQHQATLAGYFGWDAATGVNGEICEVLPASSQATPAGFFASDHLHSATAMAAMDAHTADGRVGRIYDLVFDDASWTVPWLVVALGGGSTGRRVLVPSSKVRSLDKERLVVTLALGPAELHVLPIFDPHEPVNDRGGKRRFDYFGHAVRAVPSRSELRSLSI